MKITRNAGLLYPIILLVATAQLVYLNSLPNQFTYDDEFTIVNNYFIKTWGNFPSLFNKEYFTLSGELSYRPVVTLSYYIDYALWQLNPLGFHLTNSLLHTFNAVSLFFLSLQFFKRRVVAFPAALLFACHPVLSETVNAISYREDLLGTAFMTAAFLLYLKARKRHQPFSSSYFCSVICYLFSVFSKEITITLPLLIFFCDILIAKKTNLLDKLLNNSGYLCITIFYLAVRFVLLHNPLESHVSYPCDSILVNFLTMSKVLASYVKLLFFPFHLSADYVMPLSHSPADISFVLSFLFLSSVFVIVIRLFFYAKTAFFACLWFFISLLPALNIVPIENIMAERYLYLPTLGFCMLAGHLCESYRNAGLFEKYSRRQRLSRQGHRGDLEKGMNGRSAEIGNPVSYQHTLSFLKIFPEKERFLLWNTVAITILILVLTIFSITLVRRNHVWVNQIVLWTSTAKRTPDSFKAHNNLGNLYRETGRFDEAIVELKRAIQLYDKYIDAHNNLGVAYRKKGMLNEAVSEYKKALQLNPRYPYAHNNLGVLYAKSGLPDLAIEAFGNALANKPDYPDAHNNLGAVYIKKGFYEKAIDECLAAIKFHNRYKDAYYNLSVAYFNSKQYDKALDASKRVLSLEPDHHDAQEIIALILGQTGTAEK